MGRGKRGYLPAIVAPLTAAASAISTTAAAGAILFGPGFVHIESPAIHVAAVQRGNGFLPFAVVRHLDESKSSGPSGIPIRDDVYAVNRTELLEHGSDGAFGGIETEISYENIFQVSLLSGICRTANAGRITGKTELYERPELAGLSNYALIIARSLLDSKE